MELFDGNQTVIVTGAAAGIGRAVAEKLAEERANVVVADITEETGEQAAADLTDQYGGKHLFVKTDVTDRASVEGMVRAAIDANGRIDALVNNAGILIPRLLVDPAGKEELTEEIWDKMTAVNQKGAFLCAQAVVRHMIGRGGGGVVINMTSESGLEGSQGQSAYAATKAAMYSMSRSWAKELGQHDIRVVGVAPGILEVTDLRTDAYEKGLAYTRGITVEQLRASYEKVSIPIGRAGKLEEVANVVAFLISPAASYITGTVVNISGGKSRA